MEVLKRHWKERPNAVYLGALAVLVLVSWLVGLFFVPVQETVEPGNNSSVNVSETGENSEAETEEGLGGIKFCVPNPGQYVKVELVPEKGGTAVVEATKYGLGLVLTLAPEYTKSVLSFTFPHPGKYRVTIKPADDRLPTDISEYAYTTRVSVVGIKTDDTEIKLGECTWDKQHLTPAIEVLATDVRAVNISVGTAGKNGTETDMYGPWFPLRVQFAEVKPDASNPTR